MSKVIKIKRGLNIKLLGKAEKKLSAETIHPSVFAISPGDFHGIPPKLTIKEGEVVKAGTTLFTDKRRPEIKFVSPVSGVVSKIVRGEKRKLLTIEIEAEPTIQYQDFGKKNITSLTDIQIKEYLLEAGVWPFIKQRPYDLIASPVDVPRDIFISGFDSAPLAPDMDFVLEGEKENFQTGINALAKLTKGKVYLGLSVKTSSSVLKNTKNAEIIEFDGPHPAGNVGVQIHHIKPINQGEVVWTIHPADVVVIGRLFNEGIADFTRVIAFTGSEVEERIYTKILPGASIKGKIKVNKGKELRYISGNVLTGKRIPADGFLGFYDHQITVIPEGKEKNDILGWISPGFTKYSVHSSFVSWFLDKFGKNREYVIDARLKGGERAIIMSHEYDKVFPMDIYPEYLIKATLAFNIDRMEQLGIYEVAPEDFALCEFVDTSKLEIQRIIREGLDKLHSEMT
ncbi:MAG: Na(+)-translocating NADH-quinone reductase subunit A [Candidatus Azobacteroides sp.]|nr:Na(+)-translocating NADH-quinone reductase subunit A [Candidatus Azobacteroides sp.]